MNVYLQINMRKVCNNAYQQYVRSRPNASAESVKRIKELRINEAGILPQYTDASHIDTADIISRMKNYRPQGVSIRLIYIIKYYASILISKFFNRRYLKLVRRQIQLIIK